MQLSLLFAALFSLLFSLAEAQYKVTNPTSDKTWQANTPYNVNWRATAGKQLSDFGQFTVSLYGGAKSNRTLLTTVRAELARKSQERVLHSGIILTHTCRYSLAR